jgi:hypothetical protein
VNRGGLLGLDARVLDAFVAMLVGYQVKTVELKMCAVRSFLRFASADGFVGPAVLAVRSSRHSLRHMLATKLMEGGTPVEQIADILGHQSVESTGVYLKSSLSLL